MKKEEYIFFTKKRLLNSLKGQADTVVNKNKSMVSDNERKLEISVIEEFVKYIQDFERNQKKLELEREER